MLHILTRSLVLAVLVNVATHYVTGAPYVEPPIADFVFWRAMPEPLGAPQRARRFPVVRLPVAAPPRAPLPPRRPPHHERRWKHLALR